MNILKSTIMLLLIFAGVINADWTDENGSNPNTFTKPVHFWNAVVTTSTTQQTSLNAVFPFSSELQAMNAIFQTDSEYKNAVRIRLDENSLTNLANFATTNISVQLDTIMDNLYTTGIWAVATATNSSKAYTDTLISSETQDRINGDNNAVQEAQTLVGLEESARMAADALKFDKAGGAISGDVIVTGTCYIVNSGANSKTSISSSQIQLHHHYYPQGTDINITPGLSGPDTYLNVNDQIRCSAPSNDSEVALLSTVKTFTNEAFVTAKAYADSLDTGGTNALTENRYVNVSGDIMSDDLKMSPAKKVKCSTTSGSYVEFNTLDIELSGGDNIFLKGGAVTLKGGAGATGEGDVVISSSSMNTPTSVVTKAYVDAATNECGNLYIKKSGGTIENNLIVSNSVKVVGDTIGSDYIDVQDDKIIFYYALRTATLEPYHDGTETDLIFNNNIKTAEPISDNDVTTKNYVDAATNQCANLYVKKSGDTMINHLSLSDNADIRLSDSSQLRSYLGYAHIKFNNDAAFTTDLELETDKTYGNDIIFNSGNDILIASSDINTPSSVVTKAYVDTATNAVQTVQETTVTNISDYVSLNNISNYIYKLTADNTTISGKTQTWVTATIKLKDLNNNSAPDVDRCYDIVLTEDVSDAIALSKGDLIPIVNNKSYKVVAQSPTSTIGISLKNNDDPDTENMYVTYGQSTIKITFNFTP